jgi:hypothetical protein
MFYLDADVTAGMLKVNVQKAIHPNTKLQSKPMSSQRITVAKDSSFPTKQLARSNYQSKK